MELGFTKVYLSSPLFSLERIIFAEQRNVVQRAALGLTLFR